MAGPDLRILIVGAGPAGLRAAELLVGAGCTPILVDEAPRIGGQIYRQPPRVPGFTRTAKELYGAGAERAKDLFVAFDRIRHKIDYRPSSLVYDLIDDRAIVANDRGSAEIAFDALILATGAMDRVVPAPGWTLPGVYTLGGAQIALKHQGCTIGNRPAFVGIGPLLLLTAYQYARAGVEPEVIVLPSTRRSLVMGSLATLRLPAAAARGLRWLAGLRLRGVPILFDHRLDRVLGDGMVSGIAVKSRSGKLREFECDSVALGYGLQSETQLADLAGLDFMFDAALRQWLPKCDGLGRAAGRDDVYLAGDGNGILGADAAEARGRLAAFALLQDRKIECGYKPESDLTLVARWSRVQAGLRRAFALPADFAAQAPDDVLLCRCEQVRAGDYRGIAGLMGAREVNRAKAYSRVGMGRCQGRLCGHAAAEILAGALGVSLDSVGRLRGQAPVKPVTVGAVAAGTSEGRTP